MFGASLFDQVSRSQQPFDGLAILHGESDIHPLVLHGCDEDSISLGTIPVTWKPHLEIPRTMNAPFSVSKCGFHDGDTFDVVDFHAFLFSGGKIITAKNDIVFRNRNEFVRIKKLSIHDCNADSQPSGFLRRLNWP